MKASPGGVRPSQRTAVLLSIVAAFAAIAVIAFALLTAVPPSIANLASSSSDGVTPTPLETDRVDAGIIVPDGWTIVRESSAAVTVRTPDGGMTAQLELIDQTADAAIRATPDIASPVRGEQLTTGRDVVHVDVAPDGVVAAVGLGADGGSVRVMATAAEGRTMAAYRPALAELLEGIAP